MPCKREENLKFCNCTYEGCVRKGICCECIKHHREKNQLPACYFPADAEKTYDRSVEKFLELRK
ncbi:MAG TPA: DUF6485 family protein [Candidatus Moranbacteria bacterium]|nr:DUF6485 family protein [Candidatus Moranbacteria bacterium]